MSNTVSASLAARVQACNLDFPFRHLCWTFDSLLDTRNSLSLPPSAFLSPCLLVAVDVTASYSFQCKSVQSLMSMASDVGWQTCHNLPSIFPVLAWKAVWKLMIRVVRYSSHVLIRSVLWVFYPCHLSLSLIFQLSQHFCEPPNIP